MLDNSRGLRSGAVIGNDDLEIAVGLCRKRP